MKVWRVITFGFWGSLFSGLLLVALGYYIFSATVLDKTEMKTALNSSGIYADIRDSATTPIISMVSASKPNKLLDEPLVKEALKASAPDTELAKRADPAIDSIYAWLDSKEPDFSISTDNAADTEQFFGALQSGLTRKIAALPPCQITRFDPENAIANAECLPIYIKPETASRQIVDALREGQTQFTTSEQAGSGKAMFAATPALLSLPSYLNYAYATALISSGLAAIIALFLLVSRRLRGVLAIGLGIVSTSIALVVGALLLPLIPQNIPIPDAVTQKLVATVINLVARESLTVGLWTLCAGIIISAISGTLVWKNRRGQSSIVR